MGLKETIYNMEKYITVMFPYPSGTNLHVGHWYNYAIVDSYCKLQCYLGNNVFQPFGFDAHGLPAENYAKKIGGDVKEITYSNIESFRKEMLRMNTSFEELLITCSDDYVKRTQWLFLKLKDHNLAYQAYREQEYCSSCQTVLAKEQVKDEKCDRCNTIVTKKNLKQWFFKITDYKERLINDSNKVDYPEKTKKQQLHWLNKLEDWCVSRQRKWGCSIPIEGEVDTLDTFVDSSFYTIEYDKTRPVDVYVGGNEHACMHLIYARFICKFLFDTGYINFDEPFKKVIHQGMILGEDGNKMSKSLGNTINPIDYKPQTLRMYLMFINHYFEGGKWQDNGYKGCERFINKFNIWTKEVNKFGADIDLTEFKQKIINYFELWKTNKIVSEWMIFYNNHNHQKLSSKTRKELIEFFNVIF